jgi:hypothetical protein
VRGEYFVCSEREKYEYEGDREQRSTKFHPFSSSMEYRPRLKGPFLEFLCMALGGMVWYGMVWYTAHYFVQSPNQQGKGLLLVVGVLDVGLSV